MSGQPIFRTVGKAAHCCTASPISLTLISSFALIKSIAFFLASPTQRALLQFPTLCGALLTECSYLSSTNILPGHALPLPPLPNPVIFFFKISKTQKSLCTQEIPAPRRNTCTPTGTPALDGVLEINYKPIQSRSQENTLEFLGLIFFSFFFNIVITKPDILTKHTPRIEKA